MTKTMSRREIAVEAAGWYGMVAILTGFVVSSLGVSPAGGLPYILLNLSGAVSLLFFAWSRGTRQLAILNSIWALVATSALVLYVREWDGVAFRVINGMAGQSVWLDRFGIFAASWLIAMMAVGLLVLAIVPVWQSRRGACTVCRVFDRKGHRLNPSALSAYAAVAAGLASILAWVSNQAFSLLVIWRNRPFVSLPDVNLLIGSPLTGKSFPSDHAAIAFAMAFSMLFFRLRLGLVFVALAAIVAWGRVFVGVHFPADVIAGAAVGAVWAILAKLFESHTGLTGWICRVYEWLCHRATGR